MAQNHLQFDGYTPPDVDEDGYTIAFAATSSDDSGRLMNGKMVNTRLFTIEAYNLKWTDIALEAATEILSKTVFKSQFDFHHFNIKTGKWETNAFYVANVDTAMYSLKEGEEKCTSLSFQVTRIDPS